MFKAKAPDGSANASGKYIKQYRLSKGYSLREFAAILQTGGLDWDHTQVLRAENGEKAVSDVELMYLSSILEISPSYLLGMEGNGQGKN